MVKLESNAERHPYQRDRERQNAEKKQRQSQLTSADPLRQPSKPPIFRETPVSLPTPPLAAIVYNRLAFGPRPGDIAAFNSLAGNDATRLTVWLSQQFNPAAIDDSELDSVIASAGYTTLNKSRTALWNDHYDYSLPWEVVSQPIREVERTKFMRAIYGKTQLLELITDFWHDHFSVYAWDEAAHSLFPYYDRMIRENAFGNFRNMLEKTAQSASMLYYLDNVYSSADGPNENYARELLELHTLGAEHYLGAIDPADVPGYPNAPAGYVEEDVFAVTKALTGWTLRNRDWETGIGDTGEFIARDDWHDTTQKRVLGQLLPADQTALADGLAVLDILANHPGTAQFISRKLCRRLVSDFPPESLVNSAAAVWSANVTASDQIEKVIRHIATSSEFASTWGEKMKRPFAMAVSSLRSASTNVIFRVDPNYEDVSNWFLWEFDASGHGAFAWNPPNGYPDVKDVWQSSSSLLMRWRLGNWVINARDDNDDLYSDIVGQTISGSAIEIVDYWIDRAVGYPISTETRAALISFMAQGINPDYTLPMTEQVQDRIRALVGLIFMSPEYQLK